MKHTLFLLNALRWRAPHSRDARAGPPGLPTAARTAHGRPCPRTGAQSRARPALQRQSRGRGKPAAAAAPVFHTKLTHERSARRSEPPGPVPPGAPARSRSARRRRTPGWVFSGCFFERHRERERGKQESSARAEGRRNSREESCRSPAMPGCAPPCRARPGRRRRVRAAGPAAAPSPRGPVRLPTFPQLRRPRRAERPRPGPGKGDTPFPPPPPPRGAAAAATHRQAEQQQREPAAAPRSPRALPRRSHRRRRAGPAPDPPPPPLLLRAAATSGGAGALRRYRPPARRHDGACSPPRGAGPGGGEHPTPPPESGSSSRRDAAHGKRETKPKSTLPRPPPLQLPPAITIKKQFQQRLKRKKFQLFFSNVPLASLLGFGFCASTPLPVCTLH